jgi:hypothetical protein
MVPVSGLSQIRNYNCSAKDTSPKTNYFFFCIFDKKDNVTFEKTYDVQNNNRLIIKLPERFRSKKRVKVIIEDVDDSRLEKIKLLRNASSDPLFQLDNNEVNSDFADSDTELI